MAKKEVQQAVDPSVAFLTFNGKSPFESRERRHRRNIVILVVLAVCLVALNIVAFSMYYSAEKKYAGDNRASFEDSLSRVIQVLDICLADDFNYDANYREIVGELSSMRSLLILFDKEDSHQVCLTELYYSGVKLPNQFRLRGGEIRNGLALLKEGKETEGYSLLQRVVDEMDTLDY